MSAGDDYDSDGFRLADLADDPFAQFGLWLAAARAAGEPQHDAMVLATAGSDGRPTARAVLLRGWDEDGLVFYSNYHSHKARQLDANPHAAACFLWHSLHRQVRVGGTVTRTTRDESDDYWRHRPRGARLAAVVSPQSEVVASRRQLEERFAALERQAGDDVTRPDDWGGYRLAADEFEFWQGRRHRLHDRARYRRTASGQWTKERLAP